MFHPAEKYTILQTDIVVIKLYRHLMCSHMIIPRENREYSPGERDLDVGLWLTGLSVWQLWVCFKLSQRYAQRSRVRGLFLEHDIRSAQDLQRAE